MRAKERVKKARATSKENPKEPKVPTAKVKPRKLVSQVWITRKQRQARKLRNLHKRIPLTILTRTGLVMTGVLNGMMIGVLLDGIKVGIKRKTFPHAHFHLEFWISVPPVAPSGSNGRR